MSTPVVTMKQLLEAGVHFGHQTRRWNPKMKRFIYGDRGGIYIIDLQQTLKRIETAYVFVRDTVADGGTILFVGTKKQAQDPIQSYAEKCGMPYVNERWLGGMLTNFETISKRVSKMAEYRRMRASGEFEAMPKKEALLISRELEKLERNLGGIAKMEKLPSAVFVLDTKKEHIAVTEANKLGLPLVAVVDTNCDPDVIQYVIPGNDDAMRSGSLLCRVIADAVDEGRLIASKRGGGSAPAARTADQEAAVAAQQAEARRQAAAAAAEREARIAAQRTAAPQPDPEAPTAAAAEPIAAPQPDAEVPATAAEPTAAAQPDAEVPAPAAEPTAAPAPITDAPEAAEAAVVADPAPQPEPEADAPESAPTESEAAVRADAGVHEPAPPVPPAAHAPDVATTAEPAPQPSEEPTPDA
ncbi:MAG: rpsB [Acidimicrobiales bacterium]|nr:rpsB [Acidimicrobiales bacterium]